MITKATNSYLEVRVGRPDGVNVPGLVLGYGDGSRQVGECGLEVIACHPDGHLPRGLTGG